MLGVAGISLLDDKDEERLVAAQAVIQEAEAYQVKMYEALAILIVSKLGEAMGGKE